MKIFRKVTLKYLRKNKVRTFATIMGILISTALICAVTTFLSSMNQYVIDNAVYNTGDWQIGAVEVDWETCQSIMQNEDVYDVVYNRRLGYAKIDETENEYKSYYYLLGVKQEFLDVMCSHITSGRFPREEREVLLPESLYETTGIELEIGDLLVLGTGNRVYRSTILNQEDPYVFVGLGLYDIEAFSLIRTRIYTVVGFYDDISYRIETASAPGYTVYTYMSDEVIGVDDYIYDIYFKTKDLVHIYQFPVEEDVTLVYNAEVLGVMGLLGNGGTSVTSIVLAACIICLILTGGIALIYNMFSISVSERTKQFGLLSSVGATQKQIKKMIWYESFVVSSVGIPLGILTGIGGIWLALQFVGDKFQALGYSIPMRMHVSWEVIIISVVISSITVLVSAWIPSKRAMKMTVIETIRQNKDIIQSETDAKNDDVIRKVLGLPGMLASYYCGRDKKKYKATLLSLCVSYILFVLVSFFMDYALKLVKDNFDQNFYDLAFYYEPENLEGYNKDGFMDLLKSEEHITGSVYTSSVRSYRAEMEKKYLSDWAIANIGTMTSAYRFKPDIVATTINITFVQDSVFRELLKKYDLSLADYMNRENPKAIVIDGLVNSNTNETTNILAGDGCVVNFTRGIQDDVSTIQDGSDIQIVEKIYFTLEGGKTIYERPYYLEAVDGLVFLYPDSLRQYYEDKNEELFPKREGDGKWTYIKYEDEHGATQWLYRWQYAEKINDYSRLVTDGICNCKFQSEDPSESYEELKKIVEQNNLSIKNMTNNADQIEKENNLIMIIQVLSGGFLILMALVAAINVFNTISANISLRRREFAVLKSIGMTEKGLNRMMLAECLLLSGKAMLYGVPISLIGTAVLSVAMSSGRKFTYSFPWIPMSVAVVGIFMIVIGTMLYIMKRRKNENVVDTLKNENV